jgi:type I restriction enzyme S subunit
MRVPALRFKDDDGQEFPEWEEKTLGDIFTFIQTNSFSRALLNYDSGIVKNIHYGDIHTKFSSNFRIKNEDVPFINENVDISNIPADCYCKEGDLVIADASEDYADIGKTIEIINTNNEKLLAGLHTYIARDLTQKMSLGFSGYLMQIESVRLQIKILATGIAVLGISKGNLGKVQLKIPSLPEQTKIANFLTAVDWKISILTQKADLLTQYKKGVMQQIFSQELRFKDDDGQEFPEWEEKTLGDLTQKISDNRNRELTDAKVYSVTNNNGFVLQSEHFDRVIAGSDLSNYKIIQKNEFAYNPSRINVGSIALFEYKIGIISSLYVCFSTTDELLDKFLLNILELGYTKFQIENLGEGGVRVYLWYDLFSLIKCKIPSLPEQTKIANFLTTIDEKITNNQTQLDAVKQYKQGLLQQMFV